MKLLTIAILVIGLATGCSNNKWSGKATVTKPLQEDTMPDKMPDDFHFKMSYGVGAKNEIDTFKGVYTKDLVLDGVVQTELVFTNEERERIYGEMKKIELLVRSKKVTNQTEDGSYCGSDPVESTIISMVINGETLEVSWTTDNCQTQDLLELEGFVDFIHKELIVTKKEYQKLPSGTGGYD
ncbi:hypothetical protein [Sutcliffiella halmapala]|uniref:hypothetical protein n=1 Tax=Sutcliffiella halmapala TaxID=79882 RepID=UPI0009956E72|nr:hypothetical protein [Sutcliffiella halmapala]